MSIRIHPRRKRRRILNVQDLQSLQDYCYENHLGVDAVRAKIQSGEIVGRKFKGRWFVIRKEPELSR